MLNTAQICEVFGIELADNFPDIDVNFDIPHDDTNMKKLEGKYLRIRMFLAFFISILMGGTKIWILPLICWILLCIPLVLSYRRNLKELKLKEESPNYVGVIVDKYVEWLGRGKNSSHISHTVIMFYSHGQLFSKDISYFKAQNQIGDVIGFYFSGTRLRLDQRSNAPKVDTLEQYISEFDAYE